MNSPSTIARAARFEQQHRIRFGHCDPTGIVYFPQYFGMFAALIEDWVTDRLGISYYELLGPRRVGMPTVTLQKDFRAISMMGDIVTLGLQVERLGSRSITLALDCTVAEELRVQVQQVIVTTDLHTHKAVDVPHDLRTAIERFCLTN